MATELEDVFDFGVSLDSLCSELGIRLPSGRRSSKMPTREWPPPCPNGTCDSRGCVCSMRKRDAGDACMGVAMLLRGHPEPEPKQSPAKDAQTPDKPARGRGRPRKRPKPEPQPEPQPEPGPEEPLLEVPVEMSLELLPSLGTLNESTLLSLDGIALSSADELGMFFEAASAPPREPPADDMDMTCYENLAPVVLSVPCQVHQRDRLYKRPKSTSV